MPPSSKNISIINVPSDIGSVYAGKSRAPAAFAAAGLESRLVSAGYDVKTYDAFGSTLTPTSTTEPGPTPTPQPIAAKWKPSTRSPNGARNETDTVNACKKVTEIVSKALTKGGVDEKGRPDYQVILSGECLYTPAILTAYADFLNPRSTSPSLSTPAAPPPAMKTIGIIYLDADTDLSLPFDPTSAGTLASMTLTHLTLRPGALPSMSIFTTPTGAPVVNPSNIVLYGTNLHSGSTTPAHLSYLLEHHYRIFPSDSVATAPIPTARAALKYLEERVDCFIVHLDVDVIDPGDFPLANVPSWTGLGFDACMSALGVFVESEMCVGLSVAEVNPDHDPEGRLVGELVGGLVGVLGAPPTGDR
jgi:arginase